LIENESIRLEEAVLQHKCTSLNGARLRLPTEETLHRPTDRRRFFMLKPDLMRLAGSTVGQGPPEGRMEAEGNRHDRRARIRHSSCDPQSLTLYRIGHIKLERKWVTLERSLAGAESKTTHGCARFFDLEDRGPGESMFRQFIGRAVHMNAVVSYPTDDRKEQGRPSGPEGRVSIPEPIVSMPILKPDEFGSMGRHVGPQLWARDGDSHSLRLPLPML